MKYHVEDKRSIMLKINEVSCWR